MRLSPNSNGNWWVVYDSTIMLLFLFSNVLSFLKEEAPTLEGFLIIVNRGGNCMQVVFER